MPPKRAASGAAANGPAKKSKTAASSAPAPPAPKAPKSKRWSAVSASANIDASFKLVLQDPVKAYSWICICPPPFATGEDEDDEDEEDESDEEDEEEDEDEDEDEEGDGSDASPKKSAKGKTKCDNGKTCLCHKPAADHPEHEWVVSYAGFRKWIGQLSMGPLRCPDAFDMYTYNDHAAYGILEVIENLFLDFVEASSWKEQWAICEGLVMFVLGPGSEFFMVEDGERACAVAELIGRLFLTMLARLEREQLLQDQSPEVKNLGLMMALFIRLGSDMVDGSLLEGDEEETVKKSSPKFKFNPSNFPSHILAYANKFAITLQGLSNIDELVAELDTDAKLPGSGEDPWGWGDALKAYSKDYSVKGKIGGDKLDITTWSSAERKQHNFENKDPLGKKEIDALKSGMVLQIM